MWYFNGSKFSENQEKMFRSLLENLVIKTAIDMKSCFQRTNYEENNPIFSAYEILIESKNPRLIRTDKFETDNWEIYTGNFTDSLRERLSECC